MGLPSSLVRRVCIGAAIVALTIGLPLSVRTLPIGAASPSTEVAGARVPSGGEASFADEADAATRTIEQRWYAQGVWRTCLTVNCSLTSRDWGADALAFDLYLRWKTAHGATAARYLRDLIPRSPQYGAPCGVTEESCAQWSDVPLWDAVAAMREYEVTGGDPRALRHAQAAFDLVDASINYSVGACPDISYQEPFGGTKKLKTLETDSNYIKAALLLYRFTRRTAYRDRAVSRYAAVRVHFLDPHVPLYSVYVFDDGATCTQLPHRFFASVNGNMIENGLLLSDATGDGTYRDEAIATAQAVDRNLDDDSGIYVNVQAENDIAEPLVEAMYDLAAAQKQPFAREWILRNAEAALSARTSDGFGRFFNGPPPTGPVTAWQTNGGFSLMMAAAALSPQGHPTVRNGWKDARFVRRELNSLPAVLHFTGSRIALVGTIGEQCCEAGHARVFIDGRESFSQTGIWQNKSAPNVSLEGSTLFAWRWPSSGRHTLRFEPGAYNAKEGGAFLHVRGYWLK